MQAQANETGTMAAAELLLALVRGTNRPTWVAVLEPGQWAEAKLALECVGADYAAWPVRGPGASTLGYHLFAERSVPRPVRQLELSPVTVEQVLATFVERSASGSLGPVLLSENWAQAISGADA